MISPAKRTLRAAALLLFFAGLLVPPRMSGADTEEFVIDGKVFGMPQAQVFDEEYDGPPAVGEYLSLAPELVPLDYEGNRVHEVRIDTVVQEIQISSGMRFRAWTFGGTVPGPVLHVREGDRVIFTMGNRSAEEVRIAMHGQGSPYLASLQGDELIRPTPAVDPRPHSMDFHSGTVAASDKWRSIPPGRTIRFEWVANYPGVFMYHCSTPSVLMHTAKGQYGAVVVQPRQGYPEPADREYVLVQSEFYLGGTGSGLRQYDHQAALDKQPALVTFNGHLTKHILEPLTARAGERVRLYVLNAGPNLIASFHLIGGIFDRTWFEGNLENEQRGLQTMMLGASNGAVLDVIVPEQGSYTFVDHSFANKEKGAAGKIVAGPRQK